MLVLTCSLVGEISWVWTPHGSNGRPARTSLVILPPWEGICYKHGILHQDQLRSNGTGSFPLGLNYYGGTYGTICITNKKVHSFGPFGIQQLWWTHGGLDALPTLMTNVKCVRHAYQKPSHISFGVVEWPYRAWDFSIGIVNTTKAKTWNKRMWNPLVSNMAYLVGSILPHLANIIEFVLCLERNDLTFNNNMWDDKRVTKWC